MKRCPVTRLMDAHETPRCQCWELLDIYDALLVLCDCPDTPAREKLAELRHIESVVAACKDDIRQTLLEAVREEARQDAVADKVKET